MNQKSENNSFNVPMILTEKSLTIHYKGKPYTLTKEHDSFTPLLNAVKAKDIAAVQAVVDILEGVATWGKNMTQGKVEVKNRKVYYKGNPVENVVTERILSWVRNGLDPKPMLRFLERLMNNPSYQSREELMLFLEKGQLPIQEDGRFLAYKKVRSDFKDIHSGKMDNSIGAIVEMPREGVDDNRKNTCSAGLHFCSKEYAQFFGGHDSKLVLLAIDPADVVSIPYDYNNTKGRACRYQVIAEVDTSYELSTDTYYEDSNYYEDIIEDEDYYNDGDEEDDDSSMLWTF